MKMMQRQTMPLIVAMAGGALAAGMLAWSLNLRGMDRQIAQARLGLKKLALSGGITPSQDVMDYLTLRQERLERQAQSWLTVVTMPSLDTSAVADLQVHVQEQLHDVHSQLERLALTYQMPVPERLGFPKELPPTDAVPRLLVQLALIRELAPLALERGVKQVISVKLEDPEPVAAPDGAEEGFLMRLPIRLRMSSSLTHLLSFLGAVESLTPLVDLRTLRLATQTTDPALLDVELGLARYLVGDQVAQ